MCRVTIGDVLPQAAEAEPGHSQERASHLSERGPGQEAAGISLNKAGSPPCISPGGTARHPGPACPPGAAVFPPSPAATSQAHVPRRVQLTPLLTCGRRSAPCPAWDQSLSEFWEVGRHADVRWHSRDGPVLAIPSLPKRGLVKIWSTVFSASTSFAHF